MAENGIKNPHLVEYVIVVAAIIVALIIFGDDSTKQDKSESSGSVTSDAPHKVESASNSNSAPILSPQVYVDPKGFFSVTPPHGWDTQEYPGDPRGKVKFQESTHVSLAILTNPVNYSDIFSLEEELRAIERKTGLAGNLTRIKFNGLPAIRREMDFQGSRVLLVDFVHGGVSHNLMYTAPRSRFESTLDKVHTSLATYSPIDKTLTASQALEHSLAKNRRLSRLLIDQGQYEAARSYIEDGLKQQREDPMLLQLREELKGKGKQ